jgi:sugar/nucleoside kinase (ribokinase family)
MKDSARLFDLDTVMVDVIMKITALPTRGSDALASEHLVATGGGFNVMSAASRHGLGAVYAGQLGTGPMADIARSSLHKEGVETPIESNAIEDLGFCLVLVDAQGERTFVTSTGAELSLTAGDLAELDVAPGDYVFVSGYNLVYPEIGSTVTTWLGTLAEGIVVAFDPGPRYADIPKDLMHAALTRSDWLFCNATEGRSLSGETSLEKVLYALLAMTGGVGVVVHDGANGCLVVTREHEAVKVAGYPAHVVDTNGAGDTHNGVFLAELAGGSDPVEAARRANAAAAIAVSSLGPATCPSRDEVSEWFASLS